MKMLEVNRKMKAILIDVVEPKVSKDDALKRLEELENLVNTYGGIVVMKAIQKRGLPDYDTYVGKGKVEEVLALTQEAGLPIARPGFDAADQVGADILIVNNILKPKQIFNLDEILRPAQMRTWDRIDLILKIFDKHAKTTEAKLQIELAGIRHMGPRIYNMGIELSQQAGARGTLGGQGETNIELMKRHLQAHELSIVKKLKHYELINKGHRDRRRRQNFKTAAIVGYTNAGKSSLLNALTGKDIYIADELFATLDTRVAKLYIPPAQTSPAKVVPGDDFNSMRPANSVPGPVPIDLFRSTCSDRPVPIEASESIGEHRKASESDFAYTPYVPGKNVLLSDTIGFIQNLPPQLIQAFKSTLAETVDADLLLHVIDINDEEMELKISIVEDILTQLDLNNKPKIYVFNKIDMLAHRIVFEDKKEMLEIKRTSNIVQAGEYASHILGWLDHKKHEEAAKKVTELKNKYAKFNPFFVSTVQKVNLDKLTNAIGESL